jgi:hypothetical protein
MSAAARTSAGSETISEAQACNRALEQARSAVHSTSDGRVDERMLLAEIEGGQIGKDCVLRLVEQIALECDRGLKEPSLPQCHDVLHAAIGLAALDLAARFDLEWNSIVALTNGYLTSRDIESAEPLLGELETILPGAPEPFREARERDILTAKAQLSVLEGRIREAEQIHVTMIDRAGWRERPLYQVALARFYREIGDPSRAESVLRQARDEIVEASGATSTRLPLVLWELADVLREAGREGTATEFEAEAKAIELQD